MSEGQEPILYGVSLGIRNEAKGKLVVIRAQADVNTVSEGDIAYIPQNVSFKHQVLLFYELIRSGVTGILAPAIGRTDHAVLLANELGVACLSDISPSITKYEGKTVTIRGDKIYRGEVLSDDFDDNPDIASLPKTETDVKLNLGFPEVLNRHRRLATTTDGVGFMRLEFILLDILENTHPRKYVDEHSRAAIESQLADQIESVLESVSERVWIRTDDFSVSQLRSMEGGDEYESPEENSMLGWRSVS